VRFHEITQPGDDFSPGDANERHWDKAVLEGLLVRSADGEGRAPNSRRAKRSAGGSRRSGARSPTHWTGWTALVSSNAATDARSPQRSRRLDELMTL
jgi:hypothetical protein